MRAFRREFPVSRVRPESALAMHNGAAAFGRGGLTGGVTALNWSALSRVGGFAVIGREELLRGGCHGKIPWLESFCGSGRAVRVDFHEIRQPGL
jgi:hypothetical protein